MDIVVWVDTYGPYGYTVAYALVAIACAVAPARRDRPDRKDRAVGRRRLTGSHSAITVRGGRADSPDRCRRCRL